MNILNGYTKFFRHIYIITEEGQTHFKKFHDLFKRFTLDFYIVKIHTQGFYSSRLTKPPVFTLFLYFFTKYISLKLITVSEFVASFFRKKNGLSQGLVFFIISSSISKCILLQSKRSQPISTSNLNQIRSHRI